MSRLGCPSILMGSVVLAWIASVAAAQPVQAVATTSSPRSEAEFLVPPQGGAFDVQVHAGAVCILSFPEQLNSKALASSPDFEIKAWGDDGIAVRAVGDAAKTSTLALATNSGAVKVNVTLTVVPANKPAYTLVRFKAVSAEEAFEAQVKAGIAARVAPLEAELGRLRQDLENHIRAHADRLVTERLLKRSDTIALSAHERSGTHVIVHVRRGVLVGDDGYLVFEIENRSGNAFRVTGVRVQAGDRDVHGAAQLTSVAADRDPSVVGVVPARSTGRGIVVVHQIDQLLGKSLTVTVAGPLGTPPVRIERGIIFR
jgi:hypothetical protein